MELEFNLNGVLVKVLKEDFQHQVTWFSWSEHTGSVTNYSDWLQSDEELVQFLNDFL